MHPFHQKQDTKFTHLELTVHDLKKMKDFYTNKLGFMVYSEESNAVELSINGQEAILKLIENPLAKMAKNGNSLYHFALLLPSRADLGLFLRHVIEQQIPIVGGADHGVSEAIYLQDIENNGIEIAWDTPEEQWKDEFGAIKMITDELDYSSIYYSVNEGTRFKGFPKDTILGHIHLSVSSLEKAKTFYLDGLGFKETKTEVPSSIFATSNNYHHHLGLNSWKGPIKKTEEMTGLKSLSITYPKCEDIASAFHKLKENGYSIQEVHQGYQTQDDDGTVIYLRLSL